ncbi:MAG: hypothetical protein PHX51_06220 [Clostridia bacterium]|nr:hypothetical protein [Clostridia bacterium]
MKPSADKTRRNELSHLKTLVFMQLQDKLDFSFTSSRKLFIRKVVLSVVKFILVAAVAFGLFQVTASLRLFSSRAIVPPEVLTVIMTVILALSAIACTVGLTKQLYYADDNRVLITYPVKNNMIFTSKLLVFYFYECLKNLTFSVPLLVGFGICNTYGWIYYIWLFVVYVFISAFPVAIGGVLSIFAMWLNRVFKRLPVLKALCVVALVAGIVYGVVKLILIIPTDIDLVGYGAKISGQIRDFLSAYNSRLWLVRCFVYMITGKAVNMDYVVLSGQTFLYFGVFVGIIGVFVLLCFLLSQPLFFKMMSSSFEYEKKRIQSKGNHRHSKYFAFIQKEYRTFSRDTGLVANFLGVYLAMPILILLLNQIYSALNTKLQGDYMTYAFNLLMILLPVLSSNSIVATLYSREGRAGYIKKTKPVKYAFPLTAKLIITIVMSSISIIAAMAIFQGYCRFEFTAIAPLTVGIVAVQVAHLFYCASCDIMNPQNEQYSTTGDTINNPNETRATIIAFLISVVIAGFSFKLFSESDGVLQIPCIKLMAIGLVLLALSVWIYYLKIKVYYLEK